MDRKYQPLTAFLATQRVDVIRLTPADIEAVLHAPLPQSAQRRHWWMNSPTANHARAWLDAGWRVRVPERRAGRIAVVTFVRRPTHLSA